METFNVFYNSNNNDDNTVNENDMQAINLFELINGNIQEENTINQIPPHFRCASHTLDLIAKSDIDKIIQKLPINNQLKKHYRKLISKCSIM